MGVRCYHCRFNRVESISFCINVALVLICCFILSILVVLFKYNVCNGINLGVNGSIKFISIFAWLLYGGISRFRFRYRCNRLRCPLARVSGLQCFNMGHNGHGINLYGVSMTLMVS